MNVTHLLTSDCFSRAANEFSLSMTIPDGLPFPYQATQRSGTGAFGTGTCGWITNEKSVVNGTIYQAGTNGATHLEGDVTLPYSNDNANGQCGSGCPGTASAQIRFNIPL